ncbi:MAG: hypothetical protein AB1529_01055 [Candidatus Micrarchaeota archaeon]
MNREMLMVLVAAILVIVTLVQAFQLYGLVKLAQNAPAQTNAPANGQNAQPAIPPKSAGSGAGMVGGC